MPHADRSRESKDPQDWKPCSNEARDDKRILYIGAVCEGCYESYPAEYRLRANSDEDDGGAGVGLFVVFVAIAGSLAYVVWNKYKGSTTEYTL